MEKIGRNARCRCGSGRKYKQCCLSQDLAQPTTSLQAWSPPRPGSAQELHALGLRALRAGEYAMAIELLTRAIKGGDLDPSCLNTLGLAYKASGRLEEAVDSFEQALVLRPEFAAASGNLGIVLFDQGRFNEAVAQFRRALACDPASAEARNNLGNALVSQGNLEEGLACLREAIALAPGYAVAHNNVGNALRLLGRPIEAITSYKNALVLQPDNPAIHANLGKSLSDFGKVQEAAAAFRRAIRLNPDFAEAYNNLGVALLELGELNEAIASIATALELRPDLAEAHFNLHSLLLDTGDRTRAMKCLVRAVELRPDDGVARCNLGMLLYQCGDHKGADEQFARAATGNAETRAILDCYRYLKTASAALPPLVGSSHKGFQIGFDAAIRDGLVLEFGVRFGLSIRQIAAMADQDVHGFDSFEGLPEAWHEEPRGSYTTAGEMPAVPGNVLLHRGWFEDTLPEFKRFHRGQVRFMNIDCDIYSSTRTVLELLSDRIAAGTVVAFDEYFGHEYWREDEFRAFQESAAKHGWRYEYLCYSTKQAVVRIT